AVTAKDVMFAVLALHERLQADVDRLKFAEINANMTKSAKDRAEAQVKELKLDLEHWRQKALSFQRDEDRAKRQSQDISSLEVEVKDLHQQNAQLLLTFQQFKTELETALAENHGLQETIDMYEMNLQRATDQKAELMGHSWSSVQFGPKDEQGFCDAKLTLVVRAGQPHNCIEEINSDVVVVSIGEPNKRGRGNRELSGFLRTLLGLAEDQVRLEDNVSSKSKTLLLKRLTCDKRSLIWQLQAKVGDKQPPRFATEEANAAFVSICVSSGPRPPARFQFDLHPDKACLSSPVQGIKNVIPQVRFDKHKKSSFPTCFSHSEYGFHQKTRGRSSLEEEPKNLVFATDDEWLIDEINMELIRVHKKTRKVKYDPKEGQMPVPLELLDTTCKTIMQFAKNRVVTQEDGWRVTERPLTMQQMKRLFMTEAYEASFKATSTAEANNEKAFENLAEASEKLGLEGTEEYKAFVRDHYRIERSSLMRLADQQYGCGQSGLYHDGVRVDEVGSFKLQHMRWRQTASRHPQHKLHLSEEDLKMDPVYSRRPERKDVVFRAGDVRSTLDDRQMAKASKAREETLEVNQALPERVRELSQANCAATRDELVNAKLHYFL
ncbi:unnamed protein product, partial [Symbiodinium necroappetens]